MQFVDEIECALRIGRSLHVDADESRRGHGRSLGHQAADDLASQLLIHIEAHMGELEADIGIELVGDDGVKNLMVELRAVAGFFRIRYIFAEVVDADAHAGAIDSLGGANGVCDLGARDEPSGDAAANGRSFGKTS